MGWQETIIGFATQFGAMAIILLAAVLIGGLVILVAWYQHLAKQYNKHKVIVWQEYIDTNGNKIPVFVDVNEKGRLYFNKALKRNFFHLKNANVKMGEYESNNGKKEITETNLPRMPYLKGGEVIMIKKLDHKTYAFAHPIMFEGNIKAICSQADMAEATASYDQNIKQYGKQPNQILTVAFYFGICVLAIVLIYVVFQKADVLLKVIEAENANTKILLEIAKTLKGQVIESTIPG